MTPRLRRAPPGFALAEEGHDAEGCVDNDGCPRRPDQCAGASGHQLIRFGRLGIENAAAQLEVRTPRGSIGHLADELRQRKRPEPVHFRLRRHRSSFGGAEPSQDHPQVLVDRGQAALDAGDPVLHGADPRDQVVDALVRSVDSAVDPADHAV
jgi:hypothetical protein